MNIAPLWLPCAEGARAGEAGYGPCGPDVATHPVVICAPPFGSRVAGGPVRRPARP